MIAELRDGWRTLSTGAALRSRIESGMCTE
jgi:hypothetical protein